RLRLMPRDQRAVCFGNRDLRELRTDAAAVRPAGADGGPVSDRAQAPAAQATLSRLGRLAQLGERLPYKQEVTGSSPVPPTQKGPGNGVFLVHARLHSVAHARFWNTFWNTRAGYGSIRGFARCSALTRARFAKH